MKSSCKKLEKKIRNKKQRKSKKKKSFVLYANLPDGRKKKFKVKRFTIIVKEMDDEE